MEQPDDRSIRICSNHSLPDGEKRFKAKWVFLVPLVPGSFYMFVTSSFILSAKIIRTFNECSIHHCSHSDTGLCSWCIYAWQKIRCKTYRRIIKTEYEKQMKAVKSLTNRAALAMVNAALVIPILRCRVKAPRL